MPRGLIVFMLMIGISYPSWSQTEETEILIGDKLFSKTSSWLTAGAGSGFYAEKQTIDPSFSFDIHLHYKKRYFSAGYFYSGTHFITQYSARKLHNYHLGYGWRKESTRVNKYLMIGPALCMGYGYYQKDNYGEPLLKGFIQPGIYGEYQITWKPIYDMGIGLAAYTSLNVDYQTAGLKAMIYLSTAYIGKMKPEELQNNQTK
jgi:hypothetical protein